MADDRRAMIILIIGIACLLGAVLLVIVDHYKVRHSLERMKRMLEAAIDGTFQESVFSESLYSALESRMAEYLGTLEISARKTAEEKERIKTIIADISHQTKTPLANIMLYTELLQEQLQSESDENRENLELLADQAQKLQFLVDLLVRLSRLETGILVLQPKKTAVLPLLSEMERAFGGKAREKGLYLKIFSEGMEEITACFDLKWTKEALGNLIDNAIKYTERGGVTVRLKNYKLFICIEVTDTGGGISEEEQAKIFGRFYRSLRVADQEGLGIGLYLTREILKQESGYIKVSSKEGLGATFSIYLPVD